MVIIMGMTNHVVIIKMVDKAFLFIIKKTGLNH